MNVSLVKLRQLAAVARCRSFSGAAEILRISQPALSRSVAAMERQCGFQIFNRIGHGVEPTAAGIQLLEQADTLLLSMQVFESNVGLLATGKAGSLRMGLPPLLASQVLADLARHILRPEAQVELRVSIRPGPVLLDELRNDAIEFFLFSESQTEPGSEVELVPIGVIQPVCVVRKGHPLANRSDLSIADLGQYPWGSSVEPPAMGEFLNPARFLCDNYHVLREAVMHTDLICICTRAFADADIREGRLRELVVANFLSDRSTVYLAKLKGRTISPLAASAIELIRELLVGRVGEQDPSDSLASPWPV